MLSSGLRQGPTSAVFEQLIRNDNHFTKNESGSAAPPETAPKWAQNGPNRLRQWSDIDRPLRDGVDMPVPSHYSAAPSGDLCTTYKSQFVVWGESRRSVSITGERPQPPRPELPLRSRPSTSVRVLAMECSSTATCALELRAAASSTAGASTRSSTRNAGGEQMKHDGVDTERQRDEGRVRVARSDFAGLIRSPKHRNEHSNHCWLMPTTAGRASLRVSPRGIVSSPSSFW